MRESVATCCYKKYERREEPLMTDCRVSEGLGRRSDMTESQYKFSRNCIETVSRDVYLHSYGWLYIDIYIDRCDCIDNISR